VLWSLVYGNLRPRRRAPRRAGDRSRFVPDWHPPSLLYLVIAIMLLSAADAVLTLNLIALGAREVNPVMAGLVEGDPALFALAKMSLTGLGVTVLVVRAYTPLFGCIPVRWVLRILLLGYAVLVAYELALLSMLVQLG
jgi:hypothetical protein